MTKIKILNNLMIFLIVAIFACSFIPFMGNGHVVAQASEEFNFEKNPIENDLLGATVDGKAFSFDDYPKDENGSATVLTLVEYGYSATSSKDFALYLYVYNPTGNPISNLSGPASQNKVNICIGRDDNGEASDYDLHVLSFLDNTDDRLFYKFKINLKDIGDGKTLYDTLDSNERKYDIIEIELKSLGAEGSNNAISYDVGFRYSYKGYQQGYDDSAKDNSTIACTVSKNLERLNLDVYHTVYRTNSSKKGAYYRNQINSCWFAIPNEVYNKYDSLDYIKATWWEYYTKLMLCTSNDDLFNSFIPWTKHFVENGKDDKIKASVTWGQEEIITTNKITTNFDFAFNVKSDSYWEGLVQFVNNVDNYVEMIPGVFLQDDNGFVSCEKVKDWIYSYNNDLGHGYIECNGRNISKDLFEDYVAEGHIFGENVKEIKFGDTFDLKSYMDDRNWIDRFFDYGWTQPLNEDSIEDLEYIKVVEDDDFSYETISEDLLIGQTEAQSFYDFYTAHKKTHKVVLLRFGVTDNYYSHSCSASASLDGNYYYIETEKDGGVLGSAYVAQETVYLDFDIIQINFIKDGKSIAIPVSSSPNDSIGGLEPPEEESFDNTIENVKDDIDDSINGLIEKIKTWFDSLSESMQSFLDILKWVGIGLGLLLVVALIGWLISLLVKFIKPINKARNKSKKRKSSSSKKRNNRVIPPRI